MPNSFSQITALTGGHIRHNAGKFFRASDGSGGIRLETLYVLYAFTAGVMLALPTDTLHSAPIYAGMRIWPEWLWAVLFFTAATCKTLGFICNWSRLRFTGALLLTFAMFFMWYCYVTTPAARTSLAVATVSVLLVGQISVTATMTRTRYRGGPWIQG